MQEVQLYIQGERVSLFEDETISVDSTIQNVRDISKIFTDFSKEFNLPANAQNNKIFKHYYNYDIVNGFDARYKVDAAIKLNGGDYRKGKLRLNTVSLKDSKPYSYKVVFFGETVSLKDLLGEDFISDLDLSAYDHEYNLSNVYAGFSTALLFPNNEVIYPLISHTNRLIYDSGGVGTTLEDTTNLYSTGGSTYGLDYKQLLPALKISKIVDAISVKYPSLQFSNDFFSQDVFTELYMLLHREKGGIYAGSGEVSKIIKMYDWVLNSGTNNLTNPLVAEWTDVMNNSAWTLDFSVATTDTGTYGIILKDKLDGSILAEYNGLTGNNTVIHYIVSDPFNTYLQQEVEMTVTTTDPSNFSTFTPSLSAKYDVDVAGITTSTTGVYRTNPTVQTILSEIIITQQMPRMKVIDFLTSIFKMFNLTAYVEDGILVVDTLDNYYADGGEIDITKYIDTTSNDVKRALLFKTIKFEYPEAKGYAAIIRNERFNEEFGNLEFTGDDKFDGGTYSVDVDYEHLMYERMTDQDNKNLTNIQWGWLADDNGDPVYTPPILFYSTLTNTAPDSVGFIGVGLTPKYFRPSNVITDESQTLNFNSEVDEWTGFTNTESLFNNYYTSYISNLFDRKTRLFSFKAYLPLSVLLTYKLNDVFVIAGKKFNINNVSTNLQTGESKLELITARNA